MVAKNNTYADLTLLSSLVLARLEDSKLPAGLIIITNLPAGGNIGFAQAGLKNIGELYIFNQLRYRHWAEEL